MQIALPGGQNWNQFMRCHLKVKFTTNGSSATWWPKLEQIQVTSCITSWPDLEPIQVTPPWNLFPLNRKNDSNYALGPLCLWRFLKRVFTLRRAASRIGPSFCSVAAEEVNSMKIAASVSVRGSKGTWWDRWGWGAAGCSHALHWKSWLGVSAPAASVDLLW